MNQGTTVLAQIIAFIDYESFRSCVRRYDGDHRVRGAHGVGHDPMRGTAEKTDRCRRYSANVDARLARSGTREHFAGSD